LLHNFAPKSILLSGIMQSQAQEKWKAVPQELHQIKDLSGSVLLSKAEPL
jgi:hypothetical protein